MVEKLLVVELVVELSELLLPLETPELRDETLERLEDWETVLRLDVPELRDLSELFERLELFDVLLLEPWDPLELLLMLDPLLPFDPPETLEAEEGDPQARVQAL